MSKKVRRKRVPNDDPTLVAMLLAMRDGDTAAGRALADWLEEREDPRAADVRELAEARCVVPVERPRWWRPLGIFQWEKTSTAWDPQGVRSSCEPGEAGSYPEAFPMACGPWWAILRTPEGVTARWYRSPQGYVLGGTCYFAFHADIPPIKQTKPRLREGFERCRGGLIAG